ncbi:hypothetical protein, partial [Lentimonas sp. CC4]
MASALAAFYAAVSRASAPDHSTSTPQRRGGAHPSQSVTLREGWPPRRPPSLSTDPQHRSTAPAHRKDEAELVPPKQITAGGMASAPSAEPQHRSTALNHCTSTQQRRGGARPSQTNHCGRDGLR